MAAPAIDESTGLPIVGVFEAINVSTGAIAASREISETITIGRCVLEEGRDVGAPRACCGKPGLELEYRRAGFAGATTATCASA